MDKINISGTGCCLLDLLYTGIDFNSAPFTGYLSKETGDGGLSPGRLVFTEEFEKFSGKQFSEILAELTGGLDPDEFNLGGPSIVALIHAAQLLGNYADVRFWGALGNDPVAEHIMEIMGNTPVKIGKIKKSARPSPFTNVLSDPEFSDGHGERTFINNIGAAWDMKPDDLGDEFFAAHIHVYGGTALVPNIHDNLTELLIHSKKAKGLTVVNTVFDFRNEKNHPGDKWPLGTSDESYRYIDVLIMDMEEASRLSGESEYVSACKFFQDVGISSFFITNGATPVTLYSDGKVFGKSPLKQIPVCDTIVTALKCDSGIVGDTTGCGDNFVGGIIASLAWQLHDKKSGNLDIFDACSWGIASGGFACFYIGGTYIESHTHEKFNLVKPYHELHKTQFSSLK